MEKIITILKDKNYRGSLIIFLFALIFLCCLNGLGITLIMLGVYLLPQVKQWVNNKIKTSYTNYLIEYNKNKGKETTEKTIETHCKLGKYLLYIYVFVGVVAGAFIDLAPTSIYYAANAPTYLYNSEFKAYKQIPRLQEINVKSFRDVKEFSQLDTGDYIKKSDYIGYQEYIKIKEEQDKVAKEITKQLLEEQRKEMEKLEKNLKEGFENIELTDYYYDFYVNPYIWASANFEQKKNIFQNCATYGKYKKEHNDRDLESAMLHTYIKSSLNGETLGKYSVFKGYEFK